MKPGTSSTLHHGYCLGRTNTYNLGQYPKVVYNIGDNLSNMFNIFSNLDSNSTTYVPVHI